MPAERLQKLIAQAGIASRRASEEIIRGGEVSVNGEIVTELGTKADPEKDHIKVRGKLINTAISTYNCGGNGVDLSGFCIKKRVATGMLHPYSNNYHDQVTHGIYLITKSTNFQSIELDYYIGNPNLISLPGKK